MSDTSDYTVLDALADPAAIVGADARLAFAEMIERLLGIHHEVSAATLRPALLADGWSRDLIDKRMAAMISAAIVAQAIRWTGQVTTSGNSKSRNAHRVVKVYTYGAGGAAAVEAWVEGYAQRVGRVEASGEVLRREAGDAA